MRSLPCLWLAGSIFVAGSTLSCTESNLDEESDQGADLAGVDDKGDGVPGIEVLARIAPGSADTRITTDVPRPGFVFYAGQGATIGLEITQAGTAAGLDTKLVVYGPRLADGTYPRTIATDEDTGYGKLSKISSVTTDIGGFYLVELANGAATSAPAANAKARLKFSCTGTCTTDQPVAPLGLELKWYQRSAERRALSMQAYSLATAKVEAAAAVTSGSWGVVMDVDETTLDNSAYQRRRGEIGLGYSPSSWTQWVNERAAEALPGALAFTQDVHALGGKVIFVTNRLDATECGPTRENLTAKGFAWDAMYCKTTSSDKNPRFTAIQDGTAAGLPATKILAFVGDNILDFPGLSQDLRTKPESAYASFGETFFQIPNPMYGSWEKNLD